MMDINELYDHNYVPYSEEPSVAIVRSRQGHWFPGVRIENISYPLTISAAQNALFCCLSEGRQADELFTEHPDESILTCWQKEFDISVQPLKPDNPPTGQFVDIALDQELDITTALEALLDDAIVEQSNFPVSAIVETDRGYYSGVNIECSSWNLGLCAERIAIGKALSYGASSITDLHIHTRKGEFSSPCGACRQVIIEHLPNCQVHLHHADGSESVHFSNDLLPHSFQSSSLSKH